MVRDEIVRLAEGQLGEPYYSMNYSESEGFGGMGTNYVGQGWGCAELCSYVLNVTLGTEYVGSCWNFAGDALGDPYTNQGGGQFVFVDVPLPGDVVLYLAKGTDGEDATDYSHAALYVSDGMVIGSWGKGKPYSPDYWPGRGVSHDYVIEQTLGNGWRYVRCTRLDSHETVTEQTGDEMICLIQPDGQSMMEYFDGTKVHPLARPEEMNAIQEVYRKTHGGAEIPTFELGSKSNPVAKHLHNALKR